MSSGVFSLMGVHIAPVYRMPQNPWLARFIRRIRLDQQSKFIERRGAVNEMLRHLEGGGNVGFLFDQEAIWGYSVQFFGKKSVTHKTPAVLARDYGYPIFFGVMIRTGPMQYEGRGRAAAVREDRRPRGGPAALRADPDEQAGGAGPGASGAVPLDAPALEVHRCARCAPRGADGVRRVPCGYSAGMAGEPR